MAAMSDACSDYLLGEIAEVIGGGTPSTSQPSYWGGSIPWITPGEVTRNEGQVVTDTERTITPKGLAASSATLLPQHAVLMTSRATVGAVALAGRPMATNQGFAALVARDGVLPRFLMYWVQANRAEFEGRASGSTFPEISRSKVKAVPIRLPGLPVQRRIVDLIGTLDVQTEALNAEVTHLGVYRFALREALMVDDSSWQESSWGDVVTRTTGISYASIDLGGLGEGLPFINLRSIGRGGGYRPEGLKWYQGQYKERQIVRAGDLLIANTDLTRDKAILGCPVIVPDLGDRGRACISLDISKLVPDTNRVLTGFLYEFLQLASSREFMKAHSSGTTVIHLKTKELAQLRLRYPTLDEQDQIVGMLSRIEALSAALDHESDRLGLMRARLLSALLSREIEIPEAYDALLESA